MYIAILFLIFFITTVINQTLQISSVSNSLTIDNQYKVSSIQGNAQIFIKGVGFSLNPPDNIVNLINNVTKVSYPCAINGATAFMLTCFTPKAPVGIYNLVLTLQLNQQGPIITAQCQTNCQITYDTFWTPQLNFITPRSQSPGEYVSFNSIPKVQSVSWINTFSLNSFFCDRFDFIYDLPFNNQWYDQSYPHCRTARSQEAGLFNSISFNTMFGDSQTQFFQASSYDIANDQAYQFRVVPSITQISSNQGSSQGQVLTINGYGFSLDQNKISVQVDGKACNLISNTVQQIICEVIPGTYSNLPNYAGSSGLKFSLFNGSMDVNSLLSVAQQTNNNSLIRLQGTGNLLETEFTGYEQDWTTSRFGVLPQYNFGQYANGYFLALETGNYTFYCSADDAMLVYLSKVPDSTLQQDQQLIINHNSWSSLRNYFQNQNNYSQSLPIQLTKGNKYYLQISYVQYGGDGTYSLSVLTPLQKSPINSIPETRLLNIQTNQQFEYLQLNISNTYNGTFRLSFNNNVTDVISLFETDLAKYLTLVNLTSTNINMTMYDINGVATTNQSLVNSVIWICQVNTYRTQFTYPSIVTTKLYGTPVANFTNIQQPTIPPNGTFDISMVQNGTTLTAYNISIFVSAQDLQNILIQRYLQFIMSLGLSQFIQVQSQTIKYTGNYTFQITYNGLAGQLGNIFTYNSQNIINNNQLIAPIVSDSIVSVGSLNQLFQPIPMDMLRYAETQASVIVNVNNITSTCPNQNCNYVVNDTSVPTITSYTWNNPQLTIVLSSNSLVNISSTTVSFADNPCQITSITATNIVCSLNSNGQLFNLVSGNYMPKILINPFGYALYQQSLAPTVVPLVCILFSPQNVNQLGGARVLLNVTGLPAKQDKNLQLKLGSYNLTDFNLYNNVIYFTAPSQSIITDNNYTIGISYNGKSTVCQDSLGMTNSGSAQITNISPNNVMPTFNGDLIITGSNFGTDKSQIQVQLIGTNKTYNLAIFQLNNTCITAFLPGGDLGTYKVQVTNLNTGINSPPTQGVDTFIYGLTVTNINKIQGSIYGGQIITITGTNFNPQANRNQVFIYTGNFNQQCTVLNATQTQLTCQTSPVSSDLQQVFLTTQAQIQVYQALVYLASCSSCNYQFISPANISSISSNTIQNQISPINVIGQGFTNFDQIIIVNQTNQIFTQSITTFVSSTQLSFTPPNLYQGVYFLYVQNQNGNSQIGAQFSVITNVTSNLNQQISLTGGKYDISGYGLPSNSIVQYQCLTDYTTGICQIQYSNETNIQCIIFSNLKQCNYQLQLITKNSSVLAGQFITQNVANITQVQQQLTNTGFNLQISGTQLSGASNVYLLSSGPAQYNNTIIYGQLSSVSTTSITASFQNVQGNQYKLYVSINNQAFADFTNQNSQNIYYNVSISNINPIISSLAGGSVLTLNGQGFGQNQVYICSQSQENLCQIINQTTNQINCTVPQAVNQVTNQMFNLVTNHLINYFASFDNQWYNNMNYLKDEDFTTGYYSNSANSYIELSFSKDLSNAALIKYIKFFPSAYLQLSNLIGNQIIGLTNGNWVNLKTFDFNFLQPGWNTFYFNSSSQIPFTKIRFLDPKGTSKLQLTEIQVFGVLNLNNAQTNFNCPIYFQAQQFNYNLTYNNIVNYQTQITPVVNSITPKMGTTAGGTNVVINGTFYNQNVDQTSVLFDNVPCLVTAVNSTQIQCTTGPRPNFVQPTVQIYNGGQLAATNQLTYLYIDRWSSQTTWGGGYPPVAGNLVSIPPGQNVLLDISTPILNTVIIQGRLIFDDANIDFHANNILVLDGGYLQIGSEIQPLNSKINIILHGSKANTPQLPMFGNKVIGVMNSKIDIHGTLRNVTWTYISQSIQPGDISFTLMKNTDWVAGEQIVVASTSFEMTEAEQRTIISNVNGLITVDKPFQFFHYSNVEAYGNFQFPMRAEVALLSRNIVVKGSDDDSQLLQYGAHIMMMGSEYSGTVGRFSNFELTQVGQSTIVGRYPIHYHKCGDIPSSYVDSVVCHNSYARFVTLHGVSYGKVTNSVVYDAFGHQFFIEDGSETKNILDGNLAMNAKQIWTLTNTDVSVANYWVTNPDNSVRNCNAAGTMFYGFWYELMEHPSGPTTDVNICPDQTPLLEFNNNIAHTNGKFGLRIKKHAPLTNPCGLLNDLTSNTPYAANPPIQSYYKNFQIWKSVQKGIQAEQVGSITFQNIMVADSGLAGIDVQVTNLANSASVENCLIIGSSNYQNQPNATMTFSQRGMYLPRSDGLQIRNITFYNFGQQAQSAAFQTCSTCEQACQVQQDGGTTNLTQLTFFNVTRKAIWNGPFLRDMILDSDGSYTGTNQMTWILAYRPHLVTPQCVVLNDTNIYGTKAVQCTNGVYMRKVSFYGAKNQILNTYPFQIANARNNLNDSSFYTVQQKQKLNVFLGDSWSINIQSGETYQAQISTGSNWNQLKMYSFTTRQPSEPTSFIRFNLSQSYELFDVTQYKFVTNQIRRTINNMNNNSNINNKFVMDRQTIYPDGNYTYDNVTKILEIAVSGVGNGSVQFTAIPCRYNCPNVIDPTTGRENFQRLWSDPSTWSLIGQPQANADLTIPYVWNLLVDIAPPQINNLILDGNLIFGTNQSSYTLQAKNIWVRQGSIIAGSPNSSYTGQIQIQLTSGQYDNDLTVDSNTYTGNNVLYVNGNLSLYGVVPHTTQARLTQNALIGSNIINVDQNQDWKEGDTLVISATENLFGQSEKVTIQQINGLQITLNQNLKFNHYGSPQQISYGGQLADMRASVGHLSRNIIITSASSWSCRVFAGKYSSKTTDYNGQTQLFGVEINNCGQQNSGNGALDLFNSNLTQIVQGSTIHDGQSYGARVQNIISNVTFNNNIFFSIQNSAFSVLGTENITFQNNLMMGVSPSPGISGGVVFAGFDGSQSKSLSQIVINNIARDIQGVGFLYKGYDCSVSNQKNSYIQKINGNQAGTSQVGFICQKFQSASCNGCSGFIAYKCGHGFDTFENTQNVTADNMILLENQVGSFLFVGNSIQHYLVANNFIMDAIPRKDCPFCYQQASDCQGLIAFKFPLSVIGGAGQIPPLGTDLRGYISICSESSFGLDTFANNFQFFNYKKVYQDYPNCQSNYLLQLLSEPDINSVLTFTNSTLVNSTSDQLIKFDDPNPLLASWQKGCGKINCTGLINILINDNDGGILGSASQALPNNYNQGVINQNCTSNANWNGYQCQGSQYGILRFLSIAWDARKLMNIPVILNNTFSSNYLNMNWEWNWLQDGSPADDRLQQYVSLFQYQQSYEILWPGNAPSQMRLSLSQNIMNQIQSNWVILGYQYQDPSSFSVFLNNFQLKFENGTKIAINYPTNNITLTNFTNQCGQNIYDYQNRHIQFVMNQDPNCVIIVQMLSVVKVTMRFDISVDDFFKSNAQATLIDKIAAFLGVGQDQISIVSVRSGSAIIDYLITPTADQQNSTNVNAIMNNINTKLTQGLQSNQLDLSSIAPVLSYSSSVFIAQTQPVQNNPNNNSPSSPNQATPTQGLLAWWKILLIVVSIIVFIGIIGIVLYYLKKKQIIINLEIKDNVKVDNQQIELQQNNQQQFDYNQNFVLNVYKQDQENSLFKLKEANLDNRIQANDDLEFHLAKPSDLPKKNQQEFINAENTMRKDETSIIIVNNKNKEQNILSQNE